MSYRHLRQERGQGGKRRDIACFVRSSWEANLMRMWKYLGTEYEYETKEIQFYAIERGTRFYKIDFYLPQTDRYVEVKGYMDAMSKTRFRRTWMYYPEIALKMIVVIDRVFTKQGNLTKQAGELLDMGFKIQQLWSYTKICKDFGFLPHWEAK